MPPGKRSRRASVDQPGPSGGRGLRAELVLLNRDGGPAFLESDHAAPRHQLQRAFVVQMRRPANEKFHALSRQQRVLGSKENSGARHIDGPAIAALFAVAFAHRAIMHLALNGKPIRPAAVGLCRGLQTHLASHFDNSLSMSSCWRRRIGSPRNAMASTPAHLLVRVCRTAFRPTIAYPALYARYASTPDFCVTAWPVTHSDLIDRHQPASGASGATEFLRAAARSFVPRRDRWGGRTPCRAGDPAGNPSY